MRSERKQKKSKRWLKITGIVHTVANRLCGGLRLLHLSFIDECSGYNAPTD